MNKGKEENSMLVIVLGGLEHPLSGDDDNGDDDDDEELNDEGNLNKCLWRQHLNPGSIVGMSGV